ncbi:MAG: transglycosylase SLT domain-containing protein [Bdellovibrionales bacterium]|jgi:soluble lytic murein transglycosylase-like protein|nr:transglycosylase SLT domain-containing protein [Bdellovibrionales bacterium]
MFALVSANENRAFSREHSLAADLATDSRERHDLHVNDSSNFALERFLREEIAGRIERVNGRSWETTERLTFTRDLSQAITDASVEFELDPFLLLAMIETESRYNKNAIGGHGELGLMQIKPSTARWITPVTDANWNCDLHEVRCNVMTSARYVRYIKDRIQDNKLKREDFHVLKTEKAIRIHTLRSYNLGPARANRQPANLENPASEILPYAAKITARAEQFKTRFETNTTTTTRSETQIAMSH